MVVVSSRRNDDMAKAIKITFYAIAVIVVMMIIIPLLNMAATRTVGTGSITTLANTITEYRWWFRLLRYTLYVAVIWFWPVIIHRVAKRYAWSTEETQLMLHYRNKILFWIVLVELVLIENMIGGLLRNF